MADLESWTVGLQQGGPLYFHSASSLQIANLALFRNKINIYSHCNGLIVGESAFAINGLDLTICWVH